MIQNLLVACGLALSVGVSSLNSNEHNADRMTTQSTTIYDGGVTTVTTQYQYETNEVNSLSDLVVGNIYKYTHLSLDDDFDIYSYFFRLYNTNYFIPSLQEGLNIYYTDSTSSYTRIEFDIGGPTFTYDINVGFVFYFVWTSGTILNINSISASDYLGEEITSVTNVMPTSLLQIFDNFINERIFNHSTLTTLKTTIFGQEMSVASWLSLSVSIVLGILFIVVLIKGAIWLFKIVGNLALLR